MASFTFPHLLPTIYPNKIPPFTNVLKPNSWFIILVISAILTIDVFQSITLEEVKDNGILVHISGIWYTFVEFSAHLWILLILSSLAILTTLSIFAISWFWQFWKVWNFGKFENFGNYCNIGNNWNIGNIWNIGNFGNIGNLVTHTKTMILLPIQPINYSIILLASKQHFHPPPCWTAWRHTSYLSQPSQPLVV